MQKKIEITKMLYFYIFAFLGIMLFFCAVSLNPNNDMWWMIATGRYIVENKSIPSINPFVIHDKYSIIIQQCFYFNHSNQHHINLCVYF